MWDGAPPATANKALQNGVSQLRRVLPEDVLRTVPRGYELRVGEDELDADRFERALDAARDDTDPESAAATLRAALELWRGPALPELADVIAAQPELARLEDRAPRRSRIASRRTSSEAGTPSSSASSRPRSHAIRCGSGCARS